MWKWIAAIGILVALPAAALSGRRTGLKLHRKGGGSFVIALGMMFASVFDPKAVQAMENIARKKEIGDHEEGESGEKP